MRPGRQPSPHITLHPEFREAVRRAMREGKRVKLMVVIHQFPNNNVFSHQLHGGFAATAVNMSRWQAVASFVGHVGEVFVPLEERKASPEVLP